MRLKTIGERVIKFHGSIREAHPKLCRIAIALYQREDDLLQTFVSSTMGETPFDHYQAKLTDVHSLQELKDTREPRLVNDFASFADSTSIHTRRLLETGVKSSYTMPMYTGEDFLGFIFFDARERDYFTDPVLEYLSLYGQLIAALVANDLNSIRALKGAVMTAREFSRFRDEETADHLSRMAHYCRQIALHIADTEGLDDEYIEYLFQFSPLHDIGKVAVPDRILLQPKQLEGDDLRIMRDHVTMGVHIVDTMIREFGFGNLAHVEILRNLVATHHEFCDGSGYPEGLRGDSIPLEGRIAAVADVFDALTSERPYKSAWEIERAVDYLQQFAGTKFDPTCVDAVCQHLSTFADIHAHYTEGRF